MVERVARTDRLSTALWSAMTTQHMRRGEDWLLKKGGFQRLSVPNSILKHLKNNTTVDLLKRKSIDDLERIFRRIERVGKTLSELDNQ